MKSITYILMVIGFTLFFIAQHMQYENLRQITYQCSDMAGALYAQTEEALISRESYFEPFETMPTMTSEGICPRTSLLMTTANRISACVKKSVLGVVFP